MENIVEIGRETFTPVKDGAPLSFNPSDPAVYARYLKAVEKITAIEKETAEKAQALGDDKENAGTQSILLMHEADKQMKEILNEVFGPGNDVDATLLGTSLMAATSSGLVVNNFVNWLSAVMERGVKTFVDEEVKAAKLNREQRRAARK